MYKELINKNYCEILRAFVQSSSQTVIKIHYDRRIMITSQSINQ